MINILTLKLQKNIKLLKIPLVKYRIHAFSGSTYFENKENSFNVIKKYKKYLPEKTLKNLYRKKFYRLGWKALKQGYYKSRLYFRDAFKLSNNYNEKVQIGILILLSFIPKIIFHNIIILFYRYRK